MAGHEDSTSFLRKVAQLLHLGAAHRGRFLDEDVLVRLERPPRELEVGGHRRRDDDRLERLVGEQVVEIRRHLRSRMAGGELGTPISGRVAEPAELGQLHEVADEVLPPLAEAGDADGRSHSLNTFPFCEPFLPVALRRSTTSCASSTSLA